MPVYRIEIHRETTHVHVIRIQRPSKELARQEARALISEDRFDELPEAEWDWVCVEGYTLGDITEEASS